MTTPSIADVKKAADSAKHYRAAIKMMGTSTSLLDGYIILAEFALSVLNAPGLSAERLAEIQRIASCSHRGEWKYRKGAGVSVDEYPDDEDDRQWDGLVVSDGTTEADWKDFLENCTDMNESDVAGVARALSEGEHFIAERDGAFIEDAHKAVPELLAEVLRLRAEWSNDDMLMQALRDRGYEVTDPQE